LGFGNVGRAFARYLDQANAAEKGNIQISGVADITGGLLLTEAGDIRWLIEQQEQGHSLADCAAAGTLLGIPAYIAALRNAGISVLVECLPTNPIDGQPALELISQVLDQGIAVVTVDKGPIVHGFRKLSEAARRNHTKLAYSGTTGVRPPATLAGCHVLEIQGVLNGTTNYILSEMQDKRISFKQALHQARDQGIAEPNPDLDIHGWDTACKILILANEWMSAGATLDDIVRVGIGPETEELIEEIRSSGRIVRLIGRARSSEGRVRLSVAPMTVGSESVFHGICGTSKGAVFRTLERGEVFAGGLSGRKAIAQTILQDVRAVCSGQ
jgi:homoserine dehydrogenase